MKIYKRRQRQERALARLEKSRSELQNPFMTAGRFAQAGREIEVLKNKLGGSK